MKINGMVKGLAIAVVLVGSVSFSNEVGAGLTPSLHGGAPTGPVGGPFTFSYDVTLAGDQRLEVFNGVFPGAAPGAVEDTSTGVLGNTFSSFFTVYDFDGYVAGSNTQPVGWGFQRLTLGSTPSKTNPFDLVSVSNLTWFWRGVNADGDPVSPPEGGQTDISGNLIPIGTFSAVSSIGENLVEHDYASAATKIAGDDTNDTALSTIGTVIAPGPNETTVPEPAALLLLGSGLAGLAGWRQWRAKRA